MKKRTLSFMKQQPEKSKAEVYVEYNKRKKMYEIRLGVPQTDCFSILAYAMSQETANQKLRTMRKLRAPTRCFRDLDLSEGEL